MTFRARPAGRRRPGWESDGRRNAYLNVGFGLVVLVGVLILGGAAGASWYGEHLEPVATVNGSNITKDDFRALAKIALFRIQVAQARIEDEFAAGRIDQSTRDQQIQFIDQQTQQIEGQVLEQLIDSKVISTLAEREGVTATDAEIDDKLTQEATTFEQRHVWSIEVEPEISDGADEPTAAQITAAREKADKALADLEAGKPWEEVSQTYSTSLQAATAGDLGFRYEEGGLDKPFATALFALEDDAHTGVVEGEDGVFRIGRVTEIVEPVEDPDYTAAIEADGIPMAGFREALRIDVLHDKLQDKIKTQALQDGPQRRVAEILIPAPGEQPDGGPLPEDAIRVRHILFSPNDDATKASTLPADDPAWKAAEVEARAAYDRIKANPDLFDSIARNDTDDAASADSGGKQSYYSSLTEQLDPAFAAAILDPEVKPGQLLEPVRSAFGWHVIQIMYRAPDIDRAKAIKAALDGGADFAEYARSDSYGPEAADGGVIGWIARFQIDQTLEDAIFGTAVGKVTDPVEASDGIHIYKVLEEKVRPLDDDQKQTVESSAFNNWYTARKNTFDIHRVGEEAAAA
jgi:parvulin-like peptidyl-prolyl isomerase